MCKRPIVTFDVYPIVLVINLIVHGSVLMAVHFLEVARREGFVAHIRGPLRRALRWLNKVERTGRECL